MNCIFGVILSFFVKVFGFTCSDLCIGGVEPILES